MSLLAVGGNVLKRMEYKEGFNYLEIKDEINEKLDFSYVDEAINKEKDIDQYLPRMNPPEDLSDYNGHNFDEFDDYLTYLYTYGFEEDEYIKPIYGEEIFYSDYLYEPISVYKRKNKVLFILNNNYDLYKCDRCKSKFLDYFEYYQQRKAKIGGNYCLYCYPIALKKKRQKIIREALEKLHDQNGIKISKQQKYIALLFKGKTNVKIKYYFADILLEDKKIIVEYDGSGHWLQNVFNEDVTKEDINKRDDKRDRLFNKLGFNVLRIVSENDMLPSDEDLLKILTDAENTFKEGEKIYKINILDVYDREKLRKITNKDLEALEIGNSKN
jgi:very-short-patch-repair endonuclease